MPPQQKNVLYLQILFIKQPNVTRKDLEDIYNDREIIDLRMQSEDLINNAESLTEEEFRNEAQRIERAIDERTAFLIQQMKG